MSDDDKISSEEAREHAHEALAECDGALVITARDAHETADDGDVAVSQGVFVDDSLPADEREKLSHIIQRLALEMLADNMEVAEPTDVGAELLRQLFGANGGPTDASDATTEESADENTNNDRMFQ